jgi:hypothetical protein
MIKNRTNLKQYLSTHQHIRGIIVSPERKFIYMKATKTAGTSILRGILEQQIDGIIHQKDHPQQFQDWMTELTDEALEDYFIFSIVRNPWDRVVSIASYFDIPLKKFLEDFDRYCEDDRIRIHALPLHIYTHLSGYQFADMICRFEALQPDMNLVFDKIGLQRVRLPYLNPSDHHHYSLYYGSEEIDLVKNLYQKDITYYGYMFEEGTPAKSRKSDRSSFFERIQGKFRSG